VAHFTSHSRLTSVSPPPGLWSK